MSLSQTLFSGSLIGVNSVRLMAILATSAFLLLSLLTLLTIKPLSRRLFVSGWGGGVVFSGLCWTQWGKAHFCGLEQRLD